MRTNSTNACLVATQGRRRPTLVATHPIAGSAEGGLARIPTSVNLVALGHDTPSLTHINTPELRAHVEAHLLHSLRIKLAF